ncbi:hypothetical protein [Spiroplasma endosymbiont of Villa modesta]|uniref:hypothetical protein n=1 Tax=Spiroplasma endosymbiont of Villa modesta TaxID=3066293 RepID=UPI00313B4D2E
MKILLKTYKTQQDTIYKNENGEEIKTNIEDLSKIERGALQTWIRFNKNINER